MGKVAEIKKAETEAKLTEVELLKAQNCQLRIENLQMQVEAMNAQLSNVSAMQQSIVGDAADRFGFSREGLKFEIDTGKLIEATDGNT